jgi:hypothetical protein
MRTYAGNCCALVPKVANNASFLWIAVLSDVLSRRGDTVSISWLCCSLVHYGVPFTVFAWSFAFFPRIFPKIFGFLVCMIMLEYDPICIQYVRICSDTYEYGHLDPLWSIITDLYCSFVHSAAFCCIRAPYSFGCSIFRRSG